MNNLEKKILEAITDHFIDEVSEFTNLSTLNAIMPIINQAMRENAVELLDTVKPTYFMNDFGDWTNELGHSFTSDQLYDLFIESKTKSK